MFLSRGQINALNTASTLFIRVSKLDIEKCEAHNEQTRLIVCERPLQEHTHTSALVTTPRATENDAPNICVYVCVVCVGGSRSNERHIFF
jgi:hypothetical protein